MPNVKESFQILKCNGSLVKTYLKSKQINNHCIKRSLHKKLERKVTEIQLRAANEACWIKGLKVLKSYVV